MKEGSDTSSGLDCGVVNLGGRPLLLTFPARLGFTDIVVHPGDVQLPLGGHAMALPFAEL